MRPLLPLAGTDEVDSPINCLFHELGVMALRKYMQIYANDMQIHTNSSLVPPHLLERILVALYPVRVMSHSVPHLHSQKDTPGWKEGVYVQVGVCTYWQDGGPEGRGG